MVAGRADLRRLLAHDDVTAVAALPHLDFALGKDLRHLHIVQQGTVSIEGNVFVTELEPTTFAVYKFKKK